jgi:signal peptidase II
MAVLAGTAVLGIGLDQATKALVVATREGKPPIRIVGQVLTIYVTRNSGAAFGFRQPRPCSSPAWRWRPPC